MGFDLSAVDAELEQLGRVPENPLHLARSFVSGFDAQAGSLAQIDDELSALAQQSGVAEPLYVTRPQRAVTFPRSADLGPAAIPHVPPVSELVLPRRSSIPLPPPPVAEAAPRAPEPDYEEPLESEPPAAPDVASPGIAEREDSSWPTAMEGAPDFTIPPERDERDSLRAPASMHPDSVPPEELQREATPITQSQEIVLPDPIPREELSTESGELSLDTPQPGSGSYSLDTQSARTSEEPPRLSSRPQPSGAHDFANMVDDEVQDALEGSQPLSIGAPAALARAARGNMDQRERDPDAEFDALLSEATDPRGIPVVGSGELDTDDLLRGLELDELEDTPITQESEADQATHEADELARSLYEEPEADNTEILDRASALAIEAQAPGNAALKPGDKEADTFREEFSLDAELDSGELEIMLEDEPSPSSSRAPEGASRPPKAPPPPPGATEKRPSILGRLFGGKRDGE